MSKNTAYELATKYDIIEGAPNRTLESAILIMGTKKFRRMPITKLGKIRGIITVTDIIRAITEIGLPEAFNESISDWMTKIPKTIDPDASIEDAAQMMSAGNFGSLLIVDHGSDILKGILTERDILKHYRDESLNAKIKDIDRALLTKGFGMIDGKETLEDAIVFMNEKHTHRILLTDDGDLTGILTANDITGLCSREREEISQNPNFLKSINAQYVATNKVIITDAETTVSDAVDIMCEHNIGSLPIEQDGEIIGIFSERSLVHYIASKSK